MDPVERKKFDEILACNPTWQELILLWCDVPNARAMLSSYLSRHFRMKGVSADLFNRKAVHRSCLRRGRAVRPIAEFRALQVAC